MADVVLKDRNGNPITYEGAKEITLHTADGGTQIFSSSIWTAETVRVDGGKITPTGNKMTISHLLKAVPDLIFIGQMDIPDSVGRNQGHIAWAIGWSRRAMDIKTSGLGYGFMNMICIDYTDDVEGSNQGRFIADQAIDEYHEYDYGMIRQADSNSFVVGPDSSNSVVKGLSTRSTYFWFAISGLGIKMNQSGV